VTTTDERTIETVCPPDDAPTTESVNRARTANASVGKSRKAAKGEAIRLASKRDLLDDTTLASLTWVLIVECMDRGLRLPKPLPER
jgi:hypothetical protein